ncbi:hypothetical protein QAD02_003128 [Eretmocerus hayati]|uniref:Uncharacterized protein n=1 Tax=Eretmocerus hayati TaxID=131215 RepID=A0ACC2NNH8_9HYME|nr:hypothetical protein QAD02_003128 [Eretmocerus hayati]
MSRSGLQPRHDSGAKERARAKQQQEEIANLPKISAFFTVSHARSHLSDNEAARDSHVIRERENCASSSDERAPSDDTYRFSTDMSTSRSSLTESDQLHQVVQPIDSDSGDSTKGLNQEQLGKETVQSLITIFLDHSRSIYSLEKKTFVCKIGELCSLLRHSTLNFLKSLSKTRWSARAKSVSALHDGYDGVQEALQTIKASPCQDNDAKLEARSLRNKLSQFDNIFLFVVQDKVLSQIDKTNQSIQKGQIDLSIIVSLLNSLEQFLQSMRLNKFTELLEKAKQVARVDEIPELDRRTRVRSVRVTRFEGAAPHTVLSGEEKLSIELFYPPLTAFAQNLQGVELHMMKHIRFLIFSCTWEN